MPSKAEITIVMVAIALLALGLTALVVVIARKLATIRQQLRIAPR